MKYRLEYSRPAAGGAQLGWEPFSDYATRSEAEQGARTLRRQFGAATRTRILPVAENAPPIGPRAGAPPAPPASGAERAAPPPDEPSRPDAP